MSAKFLQNILKKVCVLLALFAFSSRAYSQLVQISLDKRVEKANVVFEGKVTAKTSFWNEAHTQIYTANTVSVYKVFKGQLAETEVEIITHGGIVGHDMEQVSHTLQLRVGDVGVFTAIPNKVQFAQQSSRMRLKAYAGAQGFIRYDLITHSASDPFTKYNSIAANVYPEITKRTKVKITTVKAADFKIN